MTNEEFIDRLIEALRPFVDRYVWLRYKEGALWAYGDSPASIDHQIDNDRSEIKLETSNER